MSPDEPRSCFVANGMDWIFYWAPLVLGRHALFVLLYICPGQNSVILR
jgi:hypothetical protein